LTKRFNDNIPAPLKRRLENKKEIIKNSLKIALTERR
jgi:hypothetical protein